MIKTVYCRRWIFLSVALACVFYMSGCAYLPVDSSSDSLSSLLAENRYITAERRLQREREKSQKQVEQLKSRLDELTPEDIEKKQKLETSIELTNSQLAELDSQLADLQVQSEAHQNQTFEALAALRKQGLWQQADRELFELESNALPNSAISDYRSAFDEQRRKVIARLENEVLMLESKQLPARVDMYRALAQAGYGDSAIYSRLQSEEDQKKRVISALRARAKQAEQEGKLSQSLQYLASLSRLDESDAVKADVRRLRSWINANSAQANSQKGSSRFELAYGEALANKNWFEARSILDSALKKSPKNKELLAKDSYLKDVYAKNLADAKALGEQRYTEGDIEKALEVWQGALQYDSNDVDLLTNIQRAQKILNKLQELKSENPAQGDS